MKDDEYILQFDQVIEPNDLVNICSKNNGIPNFVLNIDIDGSSSSSPILLLNSDIDQSSPPIMESRYSSLPSSSAPSPSRPSSSSSSSPSSVKRFRPCKFYKRSNLRPVNHLNSSPSSSPFSHRSSFRSSSPSSRLSSSSSLAEKWNGHYISPDEFLKHITNSTTSIEKNDYNPKRGLGHFSLSTCLNQRKKNIITPFSQRFSTPSNQNNLVFSIRL